MLLITPIGYKYVSCLQPISLMRLTSCDCPDVNTAFVEDVRYRFTLSVVSWTWIHIHNYHSHIELCSVTLRFFSQVLPCLTLYRFHLTHVVNTFAALYCSCASAAGTVDTSCLQCFDDVWLGNRNAVHLWESLISPSWPDIREMLMKGLGTHSHPSISLSVVW